MSVVPIKTNINQQTKGNVTNITKAANLPQHHWPIMLSALRDCVEVAFLESGETQEQALKLSSLAISACSYYAGGQYLYLPKGLSLKKALRDAEIASLFNGNNTKELAAKFKMARQSIYKILENQRKLKILAREKIGTPNNEHS